MFTMQDADTVNTLVTALPDAELEALAAQCSTPVDLDALRSGQAVLLYAPDFVLDENGQTQWGTQAAPFAGCTAVLEYPYPGRRTQPKEPDHRRRDCKH